MKFRDVTPTWAEILPTLLYLYMNGNAEGRETAKKELLRMAALADTAVPYSKTKGSE